MSLRPTQTARVESFAPVAGRGARVLVLGSMPGVASLRAGEYYAHPQNRFWPFMGALVGADLALPYAQRLARLTASGIALWDVLHSCEREGSLDTAIKTGSARPNDLDALLARHPGIAWILFNGARAEADFLRFHRELPRADRVESRRLPSTSPANASQPVLEKLAAWRAALRDAGLELLPEIPSPAASERVSRPRKPAI